MGLPLLALGTMPLLMWAEGPLDFRLHVALRTDSN